MAATEIKRKRKTCSLHDTEQIPKRKRIQPLIIHTVSPPLTHAEPSDFMRIVQSLTGCALTRRRCKESNRGSGAPSPTSTSCHAAVSSSCTSTSTDEQHEASFSSALGLLHRASSRSAAAENASHRQRFCGENFRNLQRNSSTKKGDDRKASSSAVIMSSYEGDYEASSTAPFMTRHGELEVITCASPFMGNYEGEQEISCSSASKSSEYAGDTNNLEACDDHDLFLLDSSNATSQGLNSSVDSYLEHLLSSYDYNVPCKSSSMLADVCDPSLKELL